jgi:sugar transferase EpsL
VKRRRFCRPLKRGIDIVVSLAGLLVLLPLLAVISLLIRWRMGSPVLFWQVRPGLSGVPFAILKFRTMRAGRGPDAERMTRFGHFLRRWSLDEIPELRNVLRGEMSLVGPRPLLVEYLDRYTPEQARRHEVKPGITGWAQVHGRNAQTWEERFKLDVWYVDNWSLWLDMKILLLTIVKVISGAGISAEGHATMAEFRGHGSHVANAQQVENDIR